MSALFQKKYLSLGQNDNSIEGHPITHLWHYQRQRSSIWGINLEAEGPNFCSTSSFVVIFLKKLKFFPHLLWKIWEREGRGRFVCSICVNISTASLSLSCNTGLNGGGGQNSYEQ